MEREIQNFIEYLHKVKRTTYNTEVSYERDLRKFADYLRNQRVESFFDVTQTTLNSYILFLEREGNATSSVSRCVSALKTFYGYLFTMHKISKDPSHMVKAPKIVKKVPDVLTYEEMNLLLSQPEGNSPKEIRDKAVLELMYSTGVRVSELVGLKVDDVNFQLGYLKCTDYNKERVVPISDRAKKYVKRYIEEGREPLVKGHEETTAFFVNCQGKQMSRQGLWKLIKHYADKADIDKDINPHMLRHSFAVHLVECGTDLKKVQEILGHSDINTTQVYQDMNNIRIRDMYQKQL